MLTYIFNVTLVFIIYVEYSVGGILLRLNSQGVKTLNFKSLFHYLIHPLHNKFLWNIRSLDINYIFVIIISIIIYLTTLNLKMIFKSELM